MFPTQFGTLKLFPKYYITYFGLCNIFEKIQCKHIPFFYETPCIFNNLEKITALLVKREMRWMNYDQTKQALIF